MPASPSKPCSPLWPFRPCNTGWEESVTGYTSYKCSEIELKYTFCTNIFAGGYLWQNPFFKLNYRVNWSDHQQMYGVHLLIRCSKPCGQAKSCTNSSRGEKLPISFQSKKHVMNVAIPVSNSVAINGGYMNRQKWTAPSKESRSGLIPLTILTFLPCSPLSPRAPLGPSGPCWGRRRRHRQYLARYWSVKVTHVYCV